MMEAMPTTMEAVVLMGHGGPDKLAYRNDVRVPVPGLDEVLIRVAAAGINNTDINTRIGWYSKSVTGDTGSGAERGHDSLTEGDATWSGTPLEFPRIQGADCCGHIVAVGDNVCQARVGERVIVRSMLPWDANFGPYQCWTFGSECDGAFAQYTKAPARETFAVDCDWPDVELAAIPCAYSTAEGMLARAGVGAERVLVTGASGGVGSAAVQLAGLRGAEVTAVASASKHEAVRRIGADRLLDRDDDPVEALGAESVDVVIDLVAGPQWPRLLDVLRRGGRYAVAGAIAGPLVELDVRTLYLKDFSFFGCTWQPRKVFENLVSYIERDAFRPLVSKTFPLRDIRDAQEEFVAKTHPGKLVLLPP